MDPLSRTRLLANYYTAKQVEQLFSGTAHGHDDDYYTKAEVDAALAGKSDTGHSHALNDLDDVALAFLSDGDLLIYEDISGTWVNQALPTHTHDWADVTSEPTTLAGYGITNAYTKGETDTLLAGKSDTTHSHTLNGLSDVDTSGAADEEVLTYVLGSWVSNPLPTTGQITLFSSLVNAIGSALRSAGTVTYDVTTAGVPSGSRGVIVAIQSKAATPTTGTYTLARKQGGTDFPLLVRVPPTANYINDNMGIIPINGANNQIEMVTSGNQQTNQLDIIGYVR